MTCRYLNNSKRVPVISVEGSTNGRFKVETDGVHLPLRHWMTDVEISCSTGQTSMKMVQDFQL